MAYPRIVSERGFVQATGRSAQDWCNLLDRVGARDWAAPEIRSYLSETYSLNRWWQNAVFRAYDAAHGLGLSCRQRNGKFRCDVVRTIAVEPESLWPDLSSSSGVFSWLGANAPTQVVAGASIDLGLQGVLVLTDVDDVGWLRFERSWGRETSVAHVCLRPVDNGRTRIHVTEGNIPDPGRSRTVHQQWSKVVEELLDAWLRRNPERTPESIEVPDARGYSRAAMK